MTPATGRDPFALSEAQLQAQIVGLARHCGWQVMHVRAAEGRRGGQRAWQTTTSVPGWPDLVLWRAGQFLVAELKSARGRLRPEQRDVLATLAAAGVDARVWRPADWPEIEALLTAPRKENSDG